MRAIARALVLILAAGCGPKAKHPPANPGPTCTERLADFKACDATPSGKWKLVDLCSDALPPFHEIHGCEKVLWQAREGTLQMTGSMEFLAGAIAVSEDQITVESSLVLPQTCLYGLDPTSMPPYVCTEVQTALGKSGVTADCSWDAKDCSCVISQSFEESSDERLTGAELVSRTDPTRSRELCMEGDVLVVHATTPQTSAPDLNQLWVYER